MKTRDIFKGLTLKTLAVSGLALAGLTVNATAAPKAAAAPAELVVDQVAIAGGRLLIAGRTPKPNQIVVLVATGDKTASLPTRKFNFSLSYLPENCKIDLKVEGDELKDVVVANCMPRPIAGKDGKDGKDGKNGTDGKDGMAYGSLPGDGTTFKCWPSDIVGLWFIRDYPSPNSRTIAHLAPDRVAGGNKLNLTEPQDPLKAEKPEAAMRWAEFDQDKIFVLNRETKARAGLRGDIAADCRSIHWKGENEATVRIWER